MKTALYRHFSESGELLYIGISVNPMLRSYQHEKNSKWFFDISRISIEWHESREIAEIEERRAILDERPKYNIRSTVKEQEGKKRKRPRIRPWVVSDEHASVVKRLRASCPKSAELGVSGKTLSKILDLAPVHQSTIWRVSMRLNRIEHNKRKGKR